jgi:hypothetical protein
MEMRHCANYVYYNESMTLYSCLHYPSVSNIPKKSKLEERPIFISLDNWNVPYTYNG